MLKQEVCSFKQVLADSFKRWDVEKDKLAAAMRDQREEYQGKLSFLKKGK